MSNPQRGSQQSASIRGKALRLIDYLRELARLRTALIRSVKESAYEHILWVHSIPRDERWCFTQAWGIQAGAETDAWIKVRKYNEPRCPDVPKICERWVDSTSLREINSHPRLLATIVAAVPKNVTDANAARPEGDGQPEYRTLNLKDHPQVESEFDRYVEQSWKPWGEVHRKWQAVQSAYSQLFQIHQEQQRLGEEYELVVGLGFLQWVTPDDQVAERHLLTAQAALTFDAASGTITVGAPTDGTQLAVELDMLDLQYRPAMAETIAQESLKSAENDPWDRATVDPVLKSLAQFLAERGEYEETRLEPWPRGTHEPRVTFAPALILRRRSARGLIKVLETIRDRIAEGGQIPPEFGALVDIPIAQDRSDGIDVPPTSEPVTYFPLPTNEEQRQIADRLRKVTGVLVQGPPGTGKSHTIANLICHLLATGQRILVTAKTPRALQVLYDKLPPEIQPLCISLLGTTREERKSVEKSVYGILGAYKWDCSANDRKAKALESQIDTLRRERVLRDGQLRKFREAETYEHVVVDGTYRGTAAAIARQLADQAGSLGWIADEIGEDVQAPLTTEEVCELQSELADLTPECDADLRLRLPNDDELPEQQAFERLARFQRSLSGRIASANELLKSSWAKQLELVGGETLRSLVAAVESLRASIEPLFQRQIPWVADATAAVLSNQDHAWRELHRLTKLTLEGLNSLIPHVESLRLETNDEANEQKLRQDAAALKKHFDDGGTTGWLFFKPRIIRDLNYVLKSVRVDGQRCNNRAAVRLLAELMEAKNHLDQAWGFWNGKVSRPTGPLTLQVAELQQQSDALSAVLDVSDRLREIRTTLSRSRGVTEPAWNDISSIGEFIQAARAVLSVKELAAIERQASEYISHFRMRAQSANEHPISKMVSDAIANYDPPTLRALRERLNELHAAATRATVRAERVERLRCAAPMLTAMLTESPTAAGWPDRLRRFKEAWGWSRAKGWLEHLIRQDDVAAIEARVKQIDSQIHAAIASIAALRAWKFCHERVKDDVNFSSLSAWKLAKEKAGKEKGKYASKYLRDAQGHWEKGRTAVPAWVMPLYRVYETIDAQPGLFDVVIVDEASQCGPEALPLLYLGERVLVVGDHKQISPEAVGSSPAQVHSLAREYLYDFEHADAFDLLTSFFNHGDIRFGGASRIVLREHFRCMPEIIRFSNDLCYSETPLIPLRQYPPQRLEPLCSRYVADGYREGDGSNVINRPEAEALVKEVVKCCADSRYGSATMGVITLQGNSQAHLIQQMLLREMDAEQIERRRLICGEPYSFQGDERDVIFLSMVAAPNSKIGALTKAADERRFNVAASRARDQMWLFHSVTRNDLGESDLRRRLLEHFENPVSQIARALGDDAVGLQQQAKTANRRIVAAPPPFDSWFEVDVALAIASRGYRVVPQFPVADNKRIDMVVEGQRSQLAVECDGDAFHGLDEYERDTERQRMLERCGWRFWRIRESEFYANRDRALEQLWVVLSERGIRPVAWKSPAIQSLTPSAESDEVVRTNEFGSESTAVNETTPSPEPNLANAGSTTFQQSLPFAAQSSPEGTCSQAASQALPFCDDGRNRSGTVTSHPKLTNDERLAQQDSQALPATLHADNAASEPSLYARDENSDAVTAEPVALGKSQGTDQRETWRMTLSEWKQLREELRQRCDKEGLKRIGGLTSDFAHRFRVAEALKQGKPVPQEVLDDYPDLAGR